jgi:hypothetical protein
MRKTLLFVLVLLVGRGAAVPVAWAGEKPLTTRIESLALFKNGLAVVRRTATVDGPGVYRVEDMPEPVHGTFWIESNAVVSTRLTRRTVEVPLAYSGGAALREELAGRDVVAYFAEPGVAPASGTVVDIAPMAGSAAWSRAYEGSVWGAAYRAAETRQPAFGEMLILETPEGATYVQPGRIVRLDVKAPAETVRQRRPVMLLRVNELHEKKATLAISYLAKGMAWAPAYHVDISDPKTLVLRQSAVLRNELEAFDEAELRLISGFPSVHFAHVTSPLAPGATWAVFFQQLNQRFARGDAAMRNIVTQQAVAFNVAPPDRGLDLSATPAGEGVDLHYQPIGRHTLDEGDSLSLETASGKADYERIVEWLVPDTRGADGRYIEEHRRQNDPETFQDAVWDAVRFRNPLDFPMTTAPAMVIDGSRFAGQQMSYWVNPGEQTMLRVTRTLSVRTRAVELEVASDREIVYLGGSAFRKTTVEGELLANNHRNEPISLVIRRRFSGDLLRADGNPETTLLEEGAGHVNKRNQLTWNLTLKPNEEAKLAYRYMLLVRH